MKYAKRKPHRQTETHTHTHTKRDRDGKRAAERRQRWEEGCGLGTDMLMDAESGTETEPLQLTLLSPSARGTKRGTLGSW